MSPFDRKVDLQTLFRHKSRFVAGFTTAHTHLQLAEFSLSTKKRVQAVGGLTVAQEPSSGVTKHMEQCTQCKYVLPCRKSEDKIIITIALSTLPGRVCSLPASYSGGLGF
jgi:hypothetical protein